MALEFKKLSDVAVVETVSETANVLIEEDGVIKKVAKDEMGGVKVASSAAVGQTIVVKAVDEAGNPTEWECADMVSGSTMDVTISIAGNPYMLPNFTADKVSADTTEILNVVAKMQNNEAVNIIAKYHYTYGGDYYFTMTPVSIYCRNEGTTDTSDNQLAILFILSSYAPEPYTILMTFNTTDGTCTNVQYKKVTQS